MAMTNNGKLNDAICAAKQFIKSAEAIQSERIAKMGTDRPSISPKTTGQCRRDSMDLTRALAELRKTGV